MRPIRLALIVSAIALLLPLRPAWAQSDADDLESLLRGLDSPRAAQPEPAPREATAPAPVPPRGMAGDTFTGRGFNPDPQWTDLPEGVPESHTVTEGDTLWDICGRLLGNPWFWRKIAEINTHLRDPHWIYPGESIRLRPGAELRVANASLPGGVPISGAALDFSLDEDVSLDEGSVETTSNQLRDMIAQLRRDRATSVDVRQEGFISEGQVESVGLLANSPLNKWLLTEGDLVYLDLEEPDRWRPGDRLQIVHQDRRVYHPVNGDFVGYKVQIMGTLRILRKNPEDEDSAAALAVIEQTFGEVVRGDHLQPVDNLNTEVPLRSNMAQVEGVVVDRIGEATMVRQSMLVYLDRGLDDGVEVGNTAYVFQRGDGISVSTFADLDSDFSPDDLPRYRVANLLILRSYANTSMAVVTQASTEVHVGDRFLIVPSSNAQAR